MTVAAKCNITGYTLEQLRQLLWGFHCDTQEVKDAILENYLEYLDCATVTHATCNEGCTNDPLILGCEDFKVNAITDLTYLEPLDDGSIYFGILPTDYIGGSPPFTYLWSFDTDFFELVDGALTDPVLHIKVKNDIDINVMIGEVRLVLTDSLGCIATQKICYFKSLALICDPDYIPCPNPQNLTVENV